VSAVPLQTAEIFVGRRRERRWPVSLYRHIVSPIGSGRHHGFDQRDAREWPRQARTTL